MAALAPPASPPESTLRCFGGARPGPTLLVLAEPRQFAKTVAQLAALPGLPWMHGRIVMLHQDRFLARADAITRQIAPVDLTLSLPFAPEGAGDRHGFWQVLRHAAALGMIAGRGLPHAAHSPEP